MRVEVIPGAWVRERGDLRRELRAVAAPSYVDPTEFLEVTFARSTHMYVARDGAGIAAFFCAAWERLDVGAERRDAVYMGLSATRQDLKGRGVVKRVFDRFVEDAAAWESEHGRRLILWGKTATPTMFRGLRTVFPELEPRLDGTYTELGAQVAAAARVEHGLPAVLPGVHPFVLPRVTADTTRYSAQERERIGTRRRNSETLLHRLGIDETRGDRIVVFTPVPRAGERRRQDPTP